MDRISSRVRLRKTTEASIRFRNSGRNRFFSSPRTLSFMRSYSATAMASFVTTGPEANGRVALEAQGAHVAGHDHDRVPEVDAPALRIGELPVLEDLEQDVEDLGVRLLDFVEKDDAVALPSNRLGRATLVVSDVAGRARRPGARRCGAP